MNLQTNISDIIRVQIEGVEKLSHPDQMLRAVASAVLPAMRKRVHVDGKDSSGGQIGTYSPGYLKLRTGDYQNSGKISRGVNKGKLKDAGVITRGTAKGNARPKYNRFPDPKVILSLTRQMENDLSVVASPTGYGIGFKNEANYEKSQWNELTYKKRIWGLTVEENDLAFKVANDYVTQTLNNNALQ